MHASSSRARPSEATLNPLNNIPDLEQSPSERQAIALPLERTASSIPRSSASGRSACPVAGSSKDLATTEAVEAQKETWVYPSPQQFYNALVRKGWETPEESVPMMVAIHNWMNEAAWGEVLRWEARYFAPPSASSGTEIVSSEPSPPVDPASLDVSLTRFTGRPSDLSPKARYHGWLGTLFPSRYSADRPFDRHDWMIRRDGWGEAEKDKVHRYVIDYYSAPDDVDGNPVFHLGAPFTRLRGAKPLIWHGRRPSGD